MADTKLFDDIYAISLKRLIRLENKIDKNIVQDSIKKSLDFLGIENFEEINKCAEALLKAILNTSVVRCNEITWSFISLSMASWNLIMSIALFIGWILSSLHFFRFFHSKSFSK